MTPKSPEDLSAMSEYEKDQLITELKRQVEELKENNRQSIELAIQATDDKTFYVDEIRKLINLYNKEEISLSRFAEILNIKAMAIRNVKPVHDDYDKLQAKLAAKEKECEELKYSNVYKALALSKKNYAELQAAHDAEMCAFAEWCNSNDWYYNSDFELWINTKTDMEDTTTELLKQFRDEKH
jgi:hypothetical protein